MTILLCKNKVIDFWRICYCCCSHLRLCRWFPLFSKLSELPKYHHDQPQSDANFATYFAQSQNWGSNLPYHIPNWQPPVYSANISSPPWFLEWLIVYRPTVTLTPRPLIRFALLFDTDCNLGSSPSRFDRWNSPAFDPAFDCVGSPRQPYFQSVQDIWSTALSLTRVLSAWYCGSAWITTFVDLRSRRKMPSSSCDADPNHYVGRFRARNETSKLDALPSFYISSIAGNIQKRMPRHPLRYHMFFFFILISTERALRMTMVRLTFIPPREKAFSAATDH